MKKAFLFFLAIFAVKTAMLSDARADFTVCNKSNQQVDVAFGENLNGWFSHGWYPVQSGECFAVFEGDLTSQYYYLYAKRDDGVQWAADRDHQKNGWFCVLNSETFSEDISDWCGLFRNDGKEGENQQFIEVDTRGATNFTYDLTVDGENLSNVEKGVVRQSCIASWDGVPQVHSVQTRLTWNHQSIKTKMKKQRHCYQLTVTGPIDVEGLSKAFVKNCVNSALNDKKNEYLLRALGALYLDFTGASGSASAANLYQYAEHVTDRAIACLTDTGKIDEYLRRALVHKFDATVKKTSTWIYWYL